MPQPQLVKIICGVLEQAGIEYMVTGSLASSMQGEPRASHDVDLVLQLSPGQVPSLLQAFPADEFYLDEAAVREAVRRRSVFNILQPKEGEKIDCWLHKDDAYDRSRFSRRYAADILGTRVKVSRPEDTILYKLKWAALGGGSEKHFRDALRVYEVQHGNLDHGYMDQWAETLGVGVLLKRVRGEAAIVE